MASRSSGDNVKTCDVEGCSQESHRTVSAKKVSETGLKVGATKGKVHLCREHNKEYKKKSKEARKLERLAWQ